MTDITISLEDLEVLIFGTAAIKAIEMAMDTRKRDPFVPDQNKITQALARLTTEAHSARRSKETYATAWDGPLSDKEEEWLDNVCKNHDPNVIECRMVRIGAEILYEGRGRAFRQGTIHGLANKGMVAIGTAAFAVIWPGADQPELLPDPYTFYVMPTPRGLKKWRGLQEAKSKKEQPNDTRSTSGT